MVLEATMWSPASQILNSAKKFAACPLEVSMAAVPPSNSQIFLATMSQVAYLKVVDWMMGI